MSVQTLTRRSAVTGAVIAAVAAVAGFVVARNSAAAQAKPGAAAANGYGPAISGGSGGVRLAALDQVPAGGGLVVAGSDIVLVRNASGGVEGFSATCTHQGCQVSSVQGGKILCPCHGSVFDATTGAVLSGPAGRPLPKVAVVVRTDQVFTA